MLRSLEYTNLAPRREANRFKVMKTRHQTIRPQWAAQSSSSLLLFSKGVKQKEGEGGRAKNRQKDWHLSLGVLNVNCSQEGKQ